MGKKKGDISLSFHIIYIIFIWKKKIKLHWSIYIVFDSKEISSPRNIVLKDTLDLLWLAVAYASLSFGGIVLREKDDLF